MSTARAMVVLAVMPATVLVANRASAFELLRSSNRTCSADPNLRWAPARVAVDTGDLGTGRRGLADEAVDIWQSVLGGRLRFSSGAGRPCDLNDGVTTLAFTDIDCQGSPFAGDTLAITVTSWVGDRITDADVSFNPAVTLTNASFRQVAMHEIGHVIGLDHSDACGNSGRGTLMNSRLVESLAEPQPDDTQGAFFIYPQGSTGGEVPPGANGCAVTPPGAGSAWPLLLALLALCARLLRLADFVPK